MTLTEEDLFLMWATAFHGLGPRLSQERAVFMAGCGVTTPVTRASHCALLCPQIVIPSEPSFPWVAFVMVFCHSNGESL